MHRRVIQSAYNSVFRRIISIHQSVPCSYVQTVKYCHNIPQPVAEWKASTKCEVEEKIDFSRLDPDTFGTLSGEPKDIDMIVEKMPEEPEDKEEYVIRDKEGKKQRRPMKFYYHLIKDLLEQKKIVDAIDVLEVRMKQDGIKPDYYTYNLLINGCAKVGYCKKAFKLYTQMKKTGVKRTPATYTGLFNACALSPDPEDGLMRLNNVRQKIQDAGVTLTLINYNAMMKAYARLKDVHSTFQVVDEMLSKQFTLKEETFSFLLQACISDKENGLRHALLTWHKMRRKKVRPSLYTYNLLIRCIRDCQFGDEDEVKEVIKRIVDDLPEETTFLEDKTASTQKLLNGADHNDPSSADSNVPSNSSPKKPEFTFDELEMVENRPNLLAKKPYLGNIISIRSVKTPADKLLFLGGYKNLLKEMEADGVKPDFKTFNQLLNVMPSTESSEKFLMAEMEKYKVPMNIDFCNTLIKQRAIRFDYEGAKNVLAIIQSNYLQPDLITFGVMAMSCVNKQEAVELIENMKAFSVRLNAEILGAMVHQACCHFNFDYVIFLMKLTRKLRISPNQAYMDHLELLQKRAVESRQALRKKKPVQPSIARNPNFRENSLIFSDFFAQWKKEVDIFKPPHTYKQFAKPKKKTEDSAKRSEREEEKSEFEGSVNRAKNTEWKRSTKFLDGNIDDSDDNDAFVSDDKESFRPPGKRTGKRNKNNHRYENTRKLSWRGKDEEAMSTKESMFIDGRNDDDVVDDNAERIA